MKDHQTTNKSLSSSSSPSSSSASRPLVVFGGWLGCKIHNLRRYIDLYQQFGFDTICHILPPQVIAECALNNNNIDNDYSLLVQQEQTTIIIQRTIPNEWPDNQYNNSDITSNVYLSSSSSMTELQIIAWRILSQIHYKQPSHVIFHGFSNGGAFLWKEIRTILRLAEEPRCSWVSLQNQSKIPDQNHHQQQQQQQHVNKTIKILLSIKDHFAGIVFDSSPAWFPKSIGTLLFLMSYSDTWKKRFELWSKYGLSTLTTTRATSKEQQQSKNNNDNAQQLFDFIRFETWNKAELFLYSKDDVLTNFEKLNELVEMRQMLNDRVYKQIWDSSPHCLHLKTHKNDYTKAIAKFVQGVVLHSKL